ncbi:MAG: RDD family protein, partial [Vicinamibacteria bacterium]
MICPSCKKSGPAGFKCRACGAEMMRGRYRAEEPKGGGPKARAVFRAPAHAAAGVAGGALAVDNPYATPRAARAEYQPAASSGVLASRGARLAASLIDGLAAIVILLPAFASVFFVESGSSIFASAGMLAAGSLLAFLAFAVYQIGMLVREGQTLGKKMMNIRIVDYHGGQVPSAGRLLGMRYFVNSLLGNIPLYT